MSLAKDTPANGLSIRALNSIEKSKQLGFIFNEATTVQIGYERYYGGYGYYTQKKSRGDLETQNDHMGSE